MSKYTALRDDVFSFASRAGFLGGWTWEPILGDEILVECEAIRKSMEKEWATISTPA